MGDSDFQATNLTSKEREALLTALDCGYSGVPRQGTLSEVAEELNLSDTETSEHLRRAMGKVFKQHREQFEEQLDDERSPS